MVFIAFMTPSFSLLILDIVITNASIATTIAFIIPNLTISFSLILLFFINHIAPIVISNTVVIENIIIIAFITFSLLILDITIIKAVTATIIAFKTANKPISFQSIPAFFIIINAYVIPNITRVIVNVIAVKFFNCFKSIFLVALVSKILIPITATINPSKTPNIQSCFQSTSDFVICINK